MIVNYFLNSLLWTCRDLCGSSQIEKFTDVGEVGSIGDAEHRVTRGCIQAVELLRR